MSSESNSYKGFWWLPNSPENRVPGELFISDNNLATLQLQGHFPLPFTYTSSTKPVDYIILGLTQTQKDITLVASSPTHGEFNKPDMFSSNLTYIGCHFQAEEEITFHTISVSYAYLDEWLERSGFSRNRDPDMFDEQVRKLEYKQKQPIKVQIDDYDVTIRTVMAEEYEATHQYKSFKLMEKSTVGFFSSEEKPLSDFLTFARHFQDFFTLAFGVPTFLMEMKGATEKCKRMNSSGESFPASIQIYQYLPKWQMEVVQVKAHRMPFTFPKIETRWQEYITNWVRKADKLKPIYGLFFATLYNPNLYLEGQFLNYVQALEAYQRRTTDGGFQSDDDYRNGGLYKKFVDVLSNEDFVAILPDEDLAEKYRKAIENKLLYLNQYSLNKRLYDIAFFTHQDRQIHRRSYQVER
jgi:ApeA N-terminal domain 1